MEEISTGRKVVNYVALFLFLVVLPLGSWFFLNTGANFYRGVMAELDEYGSLPDFNVMNAKGENITRKNYEGALTIIGFRNKVEDEKSLGMMKYIYDQFTENPGVLFMTVDSAKDSTDVLDFDSYANRFGIDKDKWIYVRDDEFTRTFKTKEKHSLKKNFALVDTSMMVRNYYPYDDSLKMNRLITTMSLLMPRPEKAQIVFEPEKEK